VVEYGVLLNGGALGWMLGSLGADVVKVEPPGRGDYIRDIVGTIVPRHSPIHVQYNAHKRSVVLDIKRDRCREVLRRLVSGADVFIDGGVPGAIDRLGFGYEQLKVIKHDLVYCGHTAFGADGPYSSIPMHGIGMNAMAADMVAERLDDGLFHSVPAKRPIPPRGPEATQIGAIWAAYFVAAALVQRARTGEGQLIDVSASDAVVIGTGAANVMELNLHRVTDHSAEPGFAPDGELTGAKYQFYATKDRRSILFAGMEPRLWARFCAVLDRRELIDRGDAASAMDWGHDERLRRELQVIFEQRTLREWMELAGAHALPICPAHHDLHDVQSDPHMRTRSTFVEGEHPVAGPFTYLGVPAVLPGQPFEVQRPAPLMGADTREIMAELGFSAAEVEEVLEEHAD
jgi:crotonobetainyl-CoA:carnitine CoA-transferase CaiB-like acyl-CoA transferase